MDNMKFSVSICVYGKDDPAWFETAVQSILEQTRKPDEVVLVVDGPVSAELENVISNFEKQPVFKVFRFAENQGHGNARCKGLEICSNDIIALMDADDISLPDRFEKQLKAFFDDPKLSVVGGNIDEFIGSRENKVGSRIVPSEDTEIKEYMKKRCPFNQMTVMFRKAHVQQVGGYMDWYCNEDYYLWLRMYLAGMKFANLNDVLVDVRVNEEMYRRRGGKKYFLSEFKFQKFLLKNKVISPITFIINSLKRFIVQILLPNRIRGWIFKKFARKAVAESGK